MKEKTHEEAFPIDLDKKKFTLEIEVANNEVSFKIVNGERNVYPTYDEVIGAIEIAKFAFLSKHRELGQKGVKEKKDKE